MLSYNPEHLRYLPQQEPFNKHLDAPGTAYAEHMKDVEAKRQAEEVMAMRRQAQEEEMRRGRVADEQHAIGMQRDEAHANHRDALYDKQEERRQGEVLFNRQKLKAAEHEQLLHDLYFTPGTPGTPEYIARQQYAAAALQRAGYLPPEPIQKTSSQQGADDTKGFNAAFADTQPVEVKDPTLGGTIDAEDGRLMGHVAPPTAADAKTAAELEGADQAYSKGLGVKPGFIPGRPAAPAAPAVPRSSVARSNALLDPADPYNRL